MTLTPFADPFNPRRAHFSNLRLELSASQIYRPWSLCSSPLLLYSTMKKNIPLLVVLVTLLNGCASKIPQLTDSLRQAPPCCAAISEFKFVDLPLNASKSFELGANSPAFSFASGKSYFVALRLPTIVGQRNLRVYTYAQNFSYAQYAHVFIPRVTTLDSSFQVVRTVVPAYRKGPLEITWSSGPPWVGAIRLMPTEQFLVIHTGLDELASELSSSTSNSSVVPLGKGGIAVISGPPGREVVKAGPGGEIRVEISQ